MQTRNVDGFPGLSRVALRAPVAGAAASASAPLDVVSFADRRGARRFQPVAATDLARSLGPVPALVPPAHPLLVGAAGAPPVAGPALRIATDLEAHGFQLLYKRKLWIPFLMDRYVKLTPQAFVDKSDAGCARLAVSSSAFRPVDVKGLGDLQALDAFYLGGTAPAGPAAGLVAALGSMYRNGYTFQRGHDHRDVGPFGAFSAVEAGARVGAVRYGDEKAILRTPLDASRVEFFRVGGVQKPDLPHADEGRALIALEDKQKATLWTSDKKGVRQTAEQAWQALFNGSAREIWAGDGETPLLRLTRADLLDQPGTELRLSNAIAEYRQLMNAGVDASRGQAAWAAVSVPVGSESFHDRLAAFTGVVAACGRDDEQALEAWRFVRDQVKPGQSLADVASSWCEVRSVLGHGYVDEANEAFSRLAYHLDDAAPGNEPADERRGMFLRVLGAVGHNEYAEQLWRDMWTPVDTRAEQVDTFVALHALEHGFGTAAQTDYAALVRLRAPGEKLGDVLADFAAVRRYGRDLEPGVAIEAFELQRSGLARTAPGPCTDDQRRAMFSKLLNNVKNCQVAVDAWKSMGSAGPGTELEARLRGWQALWSAERDDADAAAAAMKTVLALRGAGESVDAAVAAYVDVRARLGPNDAAAGRAAFGFVRGDMDKSLPGPWSHDEKKELYLALLSAHHDHAAALSTWDRLAGRGAAPADFPERVKTFVTLLGIEKEEAQARKSFDLLVKEQRPGEALCDTLKAYTDARQSVQAHDVDAGRAAFKFVRRDLAKTLPGGWSDDQRATMYLRVLDACKSQDAAVKIWDTLVGGKAHTHANADFPARLEAFHALHAYEGDVNASVAALCAIDDIVAARPGEKREDLVKEYLQLRPLTVNNADEGILLLQRVHCKLTPAEAKSYLKLQTETRSLYTTDQLWSAIQTSKLDVGQSTDLMCESLSKTRFMPYALQEFEAVRCHLRAGETVAQAAAALDLVRRALPVDQVTQAAPLFSYMRVAATPAQEPLFLNTVKKAGSMVPAMEGWRTTREAGPAKSFELRMRLVLEQDVLQWPGIIERMKKLEKSVPPGVDHDRAMASMIFVAAIPDANAVKTVVSKLGCTPGADRTGALEWLCGVMAAAGDVEGFEQAWADVHRAGVPGTPESRQQIFRQLLESTRRSENGFDASLDFMRCLDRFDAASFPSAAVSAVALAGAMQGHAGDAQRAFEYIVDARFNGAYGNETLDATLTRFATFYAGSHSVESALSKLDQVSSGNGGKVEQQDGDVIIGGIRVPRAKKVDKTSPLYTWFYEQLKKRGKI